MPGTATQLEEMVGAADDAVVAAGDAPNLNHPPRGAPPDATSAVAGLAAEASVDGMFDALTEFLTPALKIPLLGGLVKGIIKDFKVTVRRHARHTYGQGDKRAARGTGGLMGSLRATQLLAPLALAYLHLALRDLWRNAIPARIKHEIADANKGVAHVKADIRQIGRQLQGLRERVKADEKKAATTVPKPVRTYVTHYVKGATLPEARDRATLRTTITTTTNPQTDAKVKAHDQATGHAIDQKLLLGLGAGATVASAIASFAQKTGLDDPNCRAKNKGICSTDKGQWANLLAGLAALAALLSLEELEHIALEVADVARPVVQEVAKISA